MPVKPLALGLAAATVTCSLHVFADDLPPPPLPISQQTGEPPGVYPANPSNPSATELPKEYPSFVDLRLGSGWALRHFDTLTVKEPTFDLGIGLRSHEAAVFLDLHFLPGSTSEGLSSQLYGFDVDFDLIWGHFRLQVGLGGIIAAVQRVSRDETILGSFIDLNLGPRFDLVQWEPVTLFLRANGMAGLGLESGGGAIVGCTLGAGIDFDLYKTKK